MQDDRRYVFLTPALDQLLHPLPGNTGYASDFGQAHSCLVRGDHRGSEVGARLREIPLGCAGAANGRR
jgi:hypothetical protein